MPVIWLTFLKVLLTVLNSRAIVYVSFRLFSISRTCYCLIALGLMCELLWSDPQPQLGRSASKRGVGVQFGPDVTERFLRLNKLDYIIRSHEVKQEGYEVAHNGKCITVFSAPNYWLVDVRLSRKCDVSWDSNGEFLITIHDCKSLCCTLTRKYRLEFRCILWRLGQNGLILVFVS